MASRPANPITEVRYGVRMALLLGAGVLAVGLALSDERSLMQVGQSPLQALSAIVPPQNIQAILPITRARIAARIRPVVRPLTVEPEYIAAPEQPAIPAPTPQNAIVPDPIITATDAITPPVAPDVPTLVSPVPPAVVDPVPAAVPEPATWATMILGFFAIGWSLRGLRRKGRQATT